MKKLPHILVESKIGVRGYARPAALALLSAAAAGAMLLPGCTMMGFMAQSYRENSTREIKAEYAGLEGKSFAVVVAADRMIQADHPGLVDRLTQKITERLSASANVPRAGGFVPAEKVLKFMYDNPGWPSKPMSELAKSLGGVDRLVYVEVNEYRLNDPGNAYEWDGSAAGQVSIIESDSPAPDEFAFDKSVSVRFPDKKGFDPSSLSQSAVTTVLASRFVDRAVWLFYDHQEPYYPDY